MGGYYDPPYSAECQIRQKTLRNVDMTRFVACDISATFWRHFGDFFVVVFKKYVCYNFVVVNFY